MKSIIQEASSIAKAIEQGRAKAGNPINFSIKILEEPVKNFFGMTTKPAKIAFYFDEKPAQQPTHHRQSTNNAPVRRPEPQQSRERQERPERTIAPRPEQHTRQEPKRSEKPQPARRERPERTERTEHRVEHNEQPSQSTHKENAPQWNAAMMDAMSAWLQEVLTGLGLKNITFTIEPNNLYARITFNNHLIDNHDREKKLLASLALLLLEVVKRKFKVNLRRHKIILTVAE